MIEVSEDAEAYRSQIDGLLFDMDGVLIDISQSIRVINNLAVTHYLRDVLGWEAPENLLTSSDIELFKNAGGFNDDIDLTCAIVLHYLAKENEHPGASLETLNVFQPNLGRYARRIKERGGGLKAAEQICVERLSSDDRIKILGAYRKPVIAQVYNELFGGDECEDLYGYPRKYYFGPGYWEQDKGIIDPEKLKRISADFKLGLLTGRTTAETKLGLKVAQIDTIIGMDSVATSGTHAKKPDPRGLRALVDRLVIKAGIYVGDTVDDLQTVLNYRKQYPDAPHMLGALVLSGPMGEANAKKYRKSLADIVASDVNEILRWVAG
jgi:HAD superfamily hydrolase (TIGR01548 family)